MIRLANMEDAKEIARIRVDGWKSAYKDLIPNSFLNSLDYINEENKVNRRISGEDCDFTSEILVYEENDKVLAYSYYGKALDNCDGKYQGEVVALYVNPDYKGQGIGTKLMNYMKLSLKERGLSNMIIWCLKENYPSLRFYEFLGGTIKDERKFEIDGAKVIEVGIYYNLDEAVS